MLKDHTFRDPSTLFPLPVEEDTITVSEAISTLPTPKTAWVIGRPVLVPTKQKPWVHACQTCKRMLDIPMEWVFECTGCGESSGMELMYVNVMELMSQVQIRLTERQDTLLVTIKSPDVELLTGVAPQHLRDSHEFDLGVEEELMSKLEELTIVCFLMRKKQKFEEGQDLQAVRYTAVKSYNAMDVKKKPCPASPSKKVHLQDSEVQEKQFFSPTTSMVLKDIEAQQETSDSSRPNPAVKRNLGFVHAEEASDDKQKHVADTLHCSAATEALALGDKSEQSRVKKNR